MARPSARIEPLRKPCACPQCGKPSARDSYPFCSQRCAQIDLGRWFNQDYAIAGRDGDAGMFGLPDESDGD